MANKFSSINFGKNQESIIGRSDELAAYYDMINKFNALDEDEEIKLFDKVKDGDERAKDKIINSNLRAVVSIVRKHYAAYKGTLSEMDLISAGNIGLIKAVEKFDPTKGFKFLSFAVFEIRAAITYEISHKGRLVADYHDDAPCDHTSLDAPLSDDGDATLGDMMCISTDAEHCANESLMTDLFRVIDKILNPIEKKVLCCNFGIGDRQRSGYELSLELNKTEERIRQIKEGALFKLRGCNEGKTLLAKYLYR